MKVGKKEIFVGGARPFLIRGSLDNLKTLHLPNFWEIPGLVFGRDCYDLGQTGTGGPISVHFWAF